MKSDRRRLWNSWIALNASTSVKFEWSHYRDMDGTASIWNSLRFDYPDGILQPNRAANVDEIDIYSVVIDATF